MEVVSHSAKALVHINGRTASTALPKILSAPYCRSQFAGMGSFISSPQPSARSVSTSAAAPVADAVDVRVKDPQCSRGFTYTMYEANAWQLKFAKSGVTILVDPWLVGDLTFYGQTWAFKGKKGKLPPLNTDEIAAKADLIVITQGLPDHAHVPTLEVLPKEKPVVCSPAAAKIAADLGFKNIYELDHGKDMDFADGKLNIKATIGALVGPPWSQRENGFIFTEKQTDGIKLYYEPHCQAKENSFEVDSVDAVITPVTDQIIGGLYPLVTGNRYLPNLLRRLQPKVLVPLINAGFPSEGPLAGIISEKGSVGDLPKRLKDEGINVDIRIPADPGQSIEVEL